MVPCAPGAEADITLLELAEGDFELVDVSGAVEVAGRKTHPTRCLSGRGSHIAAQPPNILITTRPGITVVSHILSRNIRTGGQEEKGDEGGLVFRSTIGLVGSDID